MSAGGPQQAVLLYDANGDPLVRGSTTKAASLPVVLPTDQWPDAPTRAIFLQVTDGVSTLPLIMDGTTSLPVKDDETRLLLTHMLRELRAIRLMLGHATELQDDEESDL